MPVHKVRGGYQYGTSGKVYRDYASAARQGRAIQASRSRAMAGPPTSVIARGSGSKARTSSVAVARANYKTASKAYSGTLRQVSTQIRQNNTPVVVNQITGRTMTPKAMATRAAVFGGVGGAIYGAYALNTLVPHGVAYGKIFKSGTAIMVRANPGTVAGLGAVALGSAMAANYYFGGKRYASILGAAQSKTVIQAANKKLAAKHNLRTAKRNERAMRNSKSGKGRRGSRITLRDSKGQYAGSASR